MDTGPQNKAEDHSRVLKERNILRQQFIRVQRLYENKIKELSILKELGNSLRFANYFDQQDLLEKQLNIIFQNTQMKCIYLALFDKTHQELKLETSVGVAYGGLNVALVEQLAKDVIAKRVPVVIPDIKACASAQKKEGIEGGSLLGIPVMHHKSVIGVLLFCKNQINGFDQNQVQFFSLSADEIATGIILARLYIQIINEEKQRFLLSRFFSQQVMKKILGSDENLRSGGERRNVTIVFADLKGFTSMSEKLNQEKVFEILNAYFSLMIPIIFNYGGTLDKIMGDGLMAFFGAPISHRDDPYQAIRAAIEMAKLLKVFNMRHQDNGWPSLDLAVGINYGEVVAGYVGSEDHLNYTAIGDAVNVAYRIESIGGPNEILISGSMRDQIIDGINQIEGLKELVLLPKQKLKGKTKPVDIYRLDFI